MRSLRPCLFITAFLLVVCCVLYPALVTAVAHAVFPSQATGSLIEEGGVVRGSSLLGQTVGKPEAYPGYFWGRPSAASVDSATGFVVSSGSNYGPSSATLADEVKARVEVLRQAGAKGPIPVDLVTKSASGLDPHISRAAAAVQVPRVAAARHATNDDISAAIARHTEGSTLSLLGEPRVNVLLLNLDLDASYGAPASLPAPAPSGAP